MVQDTSTYYVWIGGSCDYGHKERAGGAAVVIEHNGNIISRDVISDLHTTEFRMMLTLMIKVMQEIPGGSDILFLTNAAYIQNFDKTPTAISQSGLDHSMHRGKEKAQLSRSQDCTISQESTADRDPR